jgi:UDP-N-acetylglucosamine 1-carboxyvinyltransferase
MSRLIIEGGHPLRGTVTPSGNKNAALKLLPACLLTDQPVVLHNIPLIADVQTVIEILRDLGVDVNDLGRGSWRIHAREIQKTNIDAGMAGRLELLSFSQDLC